MTITHPPDIELEGFSKYREKYYNILNNQEKPFNKKQGLFTLFTEKSKPERIMNKIYDKIKKENNGKIIFKKNQVEVLKVKEGEVQVYNEFENDDRVPLESLTSRADDSTTVKTSFT